MTTAQLSHLRAIDAHLKHLLEDIAAKRTPGVWRHNEGRRMQLSALTMHQDPVLYGDHYELAGVDGDFIASCAGNAEAGWKATRAAIAAALNCESWDGMIKEMYIRQDADTILESILAAFPLESLTP